MFTREKGTARNNPGLMKPVRQVIFFGVGLDCKQVRSMNQLASVRQLLKTFTATAGCWLACCATALAKEAEETSSKGGGGGVAWTLSYALVILVVALGLLLVLKSATRKEHAHPEKFGD
jgi:hypothetical protein